MRHNPDPVLPEWPDLEERKGHVIKHRWERKQKHRVPIHEIDPNDPELDEEDIWNNAK